MSGSEDCLVLLVRIWLHDGVPVARLMAATPTGAASPDQITVAGKAEILAAIERWVARLQGGPA